MILLILLNNGRFRVGVGIDIKKASNHMNNMLVAQSDR